MDYIYIILGIVLYLFTIYLYNKYYNITLKYIDPYIPWKKWYEQKRFLYDEEIKFYKTLYKVLHKEYGERYHIFTQVELQQLFQKKDVKAFWLNMALDFLIVDFEKDLEPVLAIELNGDIHYKDPEQGQRDLKKNRIFSLSKIPLVWIEDKDSDNEDIIYEKILPKIESKRVEKKEK